MYLYVWQIKNNFYIKNTAGHLLRLSIWKFYIKIGHTVVALQNWTSLSQPTNYSNIEHIKLILDTRKSSLTEKKKSLLIVHLRFFSRNTYFLVMKPRNQVGKKPLWTISGTWVSMNHFEASSLSLPSVPSTIQSTGASLCSILARS